MSVINLHTTLEKAKQTRNEITNIKNQVNEKNLVVEQLNNKLSDHENNINSLLKDLQNLKSNYVSKEELEQISNEISSCLEDFVINNTPRQNNDLSDKIKALEDRLNELEHQPVPKQAQDTETPVIPALHFRKPMKKVLK